MKINQTNVLVTGGGSGIGLGLVETFLSLGAKVSVLDIETDKLNKLLNHYPEVLFLQCDITDIKQVESCISKIFSEFGYVDVLVNNAGLMTSAPLINFLNPNQRKHSVDLWHKTLDVNLNSVFYVTSFIVERLIEKRKKGVVINMSSICANGNIGQSAYSAAKAGVDALTKVWSKELSGLGIRFASVAPGFCETNGLKNSLNEKVIDRWIDNVPLKRLSSIEEIIEAVLFIVRNEFFNGKVLQIDGGLVI